MVSELIDHIDVYHAEKQGNGITTQQVVNALQLHQGVFEVLDRKDISKVDS